MNHNHSFSIHLPRDSKSKNLYETHSVWKGVWYKVFDLTVEVIPGDVDSNDEVDVRDVTALINYILKGTGNNIDTDAADVNGDGEVDVRDVTALINLILKGDNPNP